MGNVKAPQKSCAKRHSKDIHIPIKRRRIVVRFRRVWGLPAHLAFVLLANRDNQCGTPNRDQLSEKGRVCEQLTILESAKCKLVNKLMQGRKLFAGARLRNLRKGHDLTQREFAKRLSVSASYLNQLENNQRPLSASVMLALVDTFDVDLAGFATDESIRLVADLQEAIADPILAGRRPSGQEMKLAIANTPDFAHAFLALYRGFRNQQEGMASFNDILERGQISTVPLPYEEIRDFFHYNDNYFDKLDKAAEARARQVGIDGDHNKRLAIERLSQKHGISVSFERENMPLDEISEMDVGAKHLRLNRELPWSSRCFQLWHRISLIEDHDEIENLIEKAEFKAPESASITRIALANFSAGATILPYGEFLAAAADCRHDIEMLASKFGASIEQVAHRLSTLQRPGARGVPFYFVRVDRAGAITKRHSTTRLQFPRYGGACPLWNVHQAFETPGDIVRQLAETTDGERYLCIARTITKRSPGYRSPIRRYAIALGSPVDYAKDIVYGDDLNVDLPEAYDQIGVSCRICSRKACPQRAVPPIDRDISINPFRRNIVPFDVD